MSRKKPSKARISGTPIVLPGSFAGAKSALVHLPLLPIPKRVFKNRGSREQEELAQRSDRLRDFQTFEDGIVTDHMEFHVVD